MLLYTLLGQKMPYFDDIIVWIFLNSFTIHDYCATSKALTTNKHHIDYRSTTVHQSIKKGK